MANPTYSRLPLPVAAVRLGLSLPELVHLLKKHRVPCIRVAGNLFILESVVEAILATGSPDGASGSRGSRRACSTRVLTRLSRPGAI